MGTLNGDGIGATRPIDEVRSASLGDVVFAVEVEVVVVDAGGRLEVVVVVVVDAEDRLGVGVEELRDVGVLAEVDGAVVEVAVAIVVLGG